ncbi:MAG TPA: T9SS type A sorting domain-containing protein, partial [Candidatus Krumholzibacterium sp.]|nr:T9SS type A sorting domain-containing protein [Candidatus Krumholzibacterium sp.]
PQTGYHVDSVFVNGSYVGAPTGYDFTDVRINYTLRATFAINIYTIEATAGPYGTITPSGAIQVPYGYGQAFSFTPSGGYETGLVIVDGQEVGTPPTYFFPGVSQDHRIEAYFRNDSITLNYVRKRWNIVSVPSVVDDFSKSALYPSSVSEAYRFQDAYVPAPTMENGPGYWLKFDDPEVVFLYGTPLMTDTFNVSEGWNMVGSVSEEVPVSNITSIPPGIVTSQFFGYTTKYEVSSAIVPARGYWVKAEQDGQLVISTSPSMHPGNRIKIVPTDELPPAPPDQSVAESKDPVPAAFALYPNYPNPFNPETAIRYDLPGGYDVTLSVYNTIGERVAFLTEGFRGPGSHIIRWDASGLPTGVYFYQLRAGPYTDIRKMVLLR